MIQNIDEAIKAVCVPVEGDPVSMEIRRSNLLKDALKESRKAKFKPTSPLLVRKMMQVSIMIIKFL